MKKLLFLLVVAGVSARVPAAPLKWSCNWPEAKSQTFSLYHGETAQLQPSFYVNGVLATNLTIEAAYYQTNGMADVWWELPGATFAPSNDCGAASYRFFVRAADAAGVNYRANGVLRMLDSPGFTPSEVALPTRRLDFSTVELVNAPYYTKSETDAKIVELSPPADLSAATNYTDSVAQGLQQGLAVAASSATNYTDSVAANLREGLAVAASSATNYTDSAVTSATNGLITVETDPTVPDWAKADTKPTYTLNEVAPNSENWLGVQGNAGRTIKILAQGSGSSPAGGVQVTASTLNNNNTTTYAYSGVAVKRNGTNTDYLFDATANNGIVRRSELSGLASSSSVSALDDDVSVLSNTVASIGAMLNAENARFVSTNYNSTTQIPSAYVEAKIDGSWLTIWSEKTRWNWLTATYLPGNFYTKTQVDSALADKADRAWGFYDSHSGAYAPDGYTWVSSPHIAIAGGLAYQRYVTSNGAIWVLESNGLVTQTGGLTNGFFRLSDDAGDTLFEIVKGDKRTIGATANAVTATQVMGVTHLYITYNVVSAEHPTLQIADSLDSPVTWYAEDNASCPANVSWTGYSGAYVAEIWPKSNSTTSLFAKAEYEIGGETYIKNTAPVSVDGGIYCTDGVHKVRPVYNNGSITWEVVQ